MEGTYPLLLDGAQAGEVRVSAQGGWTVFEVQCAMVSGIVRVSVYGEGKEGYLGVLAPEGEGLALRRKLSRSELHAFPAAIEYAGRAGAPVATPSPAPDAPVGREPMAAGAPPVEPPPEPETPPEPEIPPDEADLYWYATTDGALTAFDGEQNLLALPMGDVRIPSDSCGEPRNIDGWDYVVFRKKKGSP